MRKTSYIIHQTKTGKPDTGATGNYLQADAPYFQRANKGPTIHVGCPNIKAMKSRNPCLLDFLALPEEAHEGHITPSIKNNSLVSIEKLHDTGCKSECKAQEVTVKCKGKIIIHEPRYRTNGLWKITLNEQLRVSPT